MLPQPVVAHVLLSWWLQSLLPRGQELVVRVVGFRRSKERWPCRQPRLWSRDPPSPSRAAALALATGFCAQPLCFPRGRVEISRKPRPRREPSASRWSQLAHLA